MHRINDSILFSIWGIATMKSKICEHTFSQINDIARDIASFVDFCRYLVGYFQSFNLILIFVAIRYGCTIIHAYPLLP